MQKTVNGSNTTFKPLTVFEYDATGHFINYRVKRNDYFKNALDYHVCLPLYRIAPTKTTYGTEVNKLTHSQIASILTQIKESDYYQNLK